MAVRRRRRDRPEHTIRVLSWNVNKRRDCPGQAGAIAGLTPDIVVLQEVNAGTWPRHKDLLADAGLAYGMSGRTCVTSRP